MFSPTLLLWSDFISENWMSCGSERTLVWRTVSPSALLMEMVLSSLPRASRFWLLHSPQEIFFVCLPRMGTLLQRTHQWWTPCYNEHINTNWQAGRLTDWLNDWLYDWLNDWLTQWLIDVMNDWFNDSLIDSLTDSIIHSLESSYNKHVFWYKNFSATHNNSSPGWESLGITNTPKIQRWEPCFDVLP